MKRNKFAGVRTYEDVANSKIHFTLHRYGKILHTGSVYAGSFFNASKIRGVISHAKNKAEEWAMEHGFDGVVCR